MRCVLRRTLISSVLLISILSLLSKILGFLREGVVAYYFGTSHESDIFFLVFGIYNYLTAAIGMSLGISFLPLFVKYYAERGLEDTLRITWRFVCQLFVFSMPICVLVYVFSDSLASLIAPTYTEDSLCVVSRYIKMFSSVTFFTVVSFVLFDVLNGKRQYGVRQLTGMLFSVISIIFLVLFHPYWGIDTLIYSAITASLLQFIILIAVIFHKRRYMRFCRVCSFNGMGEIYAAILPVMLGTGIWYLRNIIDRVISSTLESGAVSALNYSGTLFSLVNTLIIASIVTVFYTELSTRYASKDYAGVRKILNTGVVTLCLLLCPVTVFCVVCSSDIITFLLQRGEFDMVSVSLTSTAFAMYLIGTPFYALRDLLTRYCYTVSDKKTPVRNSIIAVLINIPLSYYLSKCWGIGGITLASAIVSIGLTVILFVNINRRTVFLNFRGIWESVGKIGMASLVTIGLVYILKVSLLATCPVFLRLVLAGMFCLLSYGVLLYVLRCREFFVFLKNIRLKKLF